MVTYFLLNAYSVNAKLFTGRILTCIHQIWDEHGTLWHTVQMHVMFSFRICIWCFHSSYPQRYGYGFKYDHFKHDFGYILSIDLTFTLECIPEELADGKSNQHLCRKWPNIVRQWAINKVSVDQDLRRHMATPLAKALSLLLVYSYKAQLIHNPRCVPNVNLILRRITAVTSVTYTGDDVNAVTRCNTWVLHTFVAKQNGGRIYSGSQLLSQHGPTFNLFHSAQHRLPKFWRLKTNHRANLT